MILALTKNVGKDSKKLTLQESRAIEQVILLFDGNKQQSLLIFLFSVRNTNLSSVVDNI